MNWNLSWVEPEEVQILFLNRVQIVLKNRGKFREMLRDLLTYKLR